MKKTLTAAIATAVLGLGLSVSAWAQSVDGEVRKVDQAAGKITVKHGEIKNLDLPAMQMAFRVSNPAWLGSVQPGDKISFTAEKIGGQFTITALNKK